MKCPKCGAQIPEGFLMCEKCGTDIQMVPDYDPNVDMEIVSTLSDVSDEVISDLGGDAAETESKPEEAEDDKLDEDNPFADDEITLRTSLKVGAILLAALIIVVGLCIFMVVMVQHNSLDHYIGKARTYAGAEDYEQAIEYLNKAKEKYPEDTEALFLLVDYDLAAGKEADAIETLTEMINSNRFKDNDKYIAYDKLIKIYKENENYQEINSLLTACKYDSIISGYQNFLANKPEFSVEEGTYDEIITLKLNSNTSGKIYYTLDGSVPTKNSEVYSGPIVLETGKYTVSALFINIYGIESDIAVKEYYITLERPEQAFVSLESGTYYEPAMISVTCEHGCRIFYTTDETVPTEDSVPYTGAIPMPLGVTNFQFVTMNNRGIYSEPLAKTYELKLEGSISTDDAVNNLINTLIEKGFLLDGEGHRANTNGNYSYKFSSVIRTADGKDYYTINEYFDDGTGMPVRTDVVYLAGVYDGSVARQSFNEVGRFIAVPF